MSYNSVTMKADGNDKFINQIQKMSKDVIMEEVTDDSGVRNEMFNSICKHSMNHKQMF